MPSRTIRSTARAWRCCSGEPVRWRPLAKDGADLLEAARELRPAALGVGVGETYDVTWQLEEPGVTLDRRQQDIATALGFPAPP